MTLSNDWIASKNLNDGDHVRIRATRYLSERLLGRTGRVNFRGCHEGDEYLHYKGFPEDFVRVDLDEPEPDGAYVVAVPVGDLSIASA